MKNLFFAFVSLLFLSGCQTILIPDAAEVIDLQSDAKLIFVSPHDEAENVSGKTPVTFLWDTPIFKLQNPETTQRFLEEHIRISPEIEGSWQMLGTTGILFEPKTEWAGSTEYMFELDTTKIQSPLSLEYSFRTPRLAVESVVAADLIQKQPLRIEFNQKIDIAEAEKITTTPPHTFRAEYAQKESFDPQTKEKTTTPDTQTILLFPTDNWAEDTEYQLTIPETFQGAEGPLTLAKTYTQSFHTITPLSVDIQGPSDVFGAVRLHFSTEVPVDSIFDHLSVTSPNDQIPKDYIQKAQEEFERINTRETSRFISLPHPGENWTPQEPYTIHIKPGLLDQFDRQLREEQTQTFTTYFPDHVHKTFFPREHMVFQYGTVPTFSVWYSGEITSPTLTFESLLGDPQSEKKSLVWEKSRNARTVVEFDLLNDFPAFQNEEGVLDTGMYQLTLEYPSLHGRWDRTETVYFSVVDFGVEMKKNANDSWDIWAQEFDGTPLNESFDIRVYQQQWAQNKNTISQTQFIENVELPYTLKTENLFAVVLQNERHTGIGAQNFTKGMNAHDAQVHFSPYQYDQTLTGVVFPDRPLFRPGDTMYFKSLFRERQFFEKAFPLQDIDPEKSFEVQIKILSPQWEDVYQEKKIITGGALDGQWEIPKDAQLGQYQIQVQFLNQKDQWQSTLQATAYVTEYRKPDFLITSQFETNRAIHQDEVTAQVFAEYAFGGALAEKDVDYTISLLGHKKNDWFWFPIETKDLVLAEGKTQLDLRGKLTIPIDLDVDLDDDIDWNLLNLDVTVATSPESTSSQTVSIPFYQAKRSIELAPDRYFYQSTDENIPFSGTIHNLDKELQKNAPLTAKLIQTEWVRNDRKNSVGDFVGEWKSTETVVETLTLSTDKNGRFEDTFQTPKEAGQYIIRVTTKDEKNRTASAEISFWVWSDTHTEYSIRQNDKDRILPLYSDKEKYKSGETVEVLFPHNEWDIEYAHATIERGKNLQSLATNLEKNTISFTVEDWMAPNMYVSLLITGTDDTGTPQVRWGSINIPVKDRTHTLDITLTPDKDQYRPQDTVTLDIQTKISDTPTSGEVTIAVVDETLLALKSRPDLGLWKKFLAELPLGVQTTHSVANMMSDKDLEDIYEQVESIKALAESAFGGGGGNKGEDFKPRGDFRDTAAFLATVKTDEKGQATVEFPLPDNLTTWHVWAVGATEKNAFGETETNIQTTLPLLISPIMPNILRVGDQSQIGLLIRRNQKESPSEDITVTLDLPDVIVGPERTKTIEVADEARVFFRVSVPQDTSIDAPLEVPITLSIDAESGRQDAVTLNRTIYPPQTTTTAAEFLNITDTESMTLKTDQRSVQSTLTVSVFGSLLDRLEQFVDLTESRNYGCSEQSFADITAHMIWHDIQKNIGKETTLNTENITKIHQELLTLQHSNGGFRFWKRSQRPSTWLTANILEFSSLWASQGYPFPSQSLKKSSTWLRSKVFTDCSETSIDCPSDATRQYGAFVLAQRDQIKTTDLDTLSTHLSSLESKAWFLRTAQMFEEVSPETEKRIAQLHEDIERALDVKERLAFWSETDSHRSFYSQNERLTAILLDWARAENFLPERHPHIIRYLSDASENISGNTALRILSSLSKESESEGTYPINVQVIHDETALIDEPLQATDQKENSSTQLTPNTETTLTLSTQNQKPFYSDIELHEVFPASELVPVHKGFWIERKLYTLDDTDFENPITTLKSGENYVARITVVTNTDHRQTLIEDHLPSGTEGINLHLDNEDQRLQENRNGDQPMPYRGWYRPFVAHEEIGEESVRMAIPFMESGTHEFTYLLRARIAGEYEHLPVKIHDMYTPETFATGMGGEVTIVK